MQSLREIFRQRTENTGRCKFNQMFLYSQPTEKNPHYYFRILPLSAITFLMILELIKITILIPMLVAVMALNAFSLLQTNECEFQMSLHPSFEKRRGETEHNFSMRVYLWLTFLPAEKAASVLKSEKERTYNQNSAWYTKAGNKFAIMRYFL